MNRPPLTHIQSAEKHYPDAIDSLAMLNRDGLTVLCCSHSGGEGQLDINDATIIDFFPEPPRVHRWDVGNGWNVRRPRPNFHFFTPAGHPYRNDTEGRSRNIEVGLPQLWCRRVFAEAELIAPADFSPLADRSGYDPVLNGFMLRLGEIARRPCPADALLADHLAHGLTLLLGQRCIGRAAKQAIGGRLSYRQQRRLREYVDANLASPITLRDLAALLGWTPVYLAETFKATMGDTPHRWLLGRRMERARDLLRRTALPVEDIARTCGFADRSSFGKAFRRCVGCSPGSYRGA